MSFIQDWFKSVGKDVAWVVEQVEHLEPVQAVRSILPEHFQEAVTSSLDSFKSTLAPKITSGPVSKTNVKTDLVSEGILIGKVAATPEQVNKYFQGMSEFSFEILQKQLGDSSIATDNALISPMSISMLMAMNMHGVDAKTMQELSQYIHLPGDGRELQACVQQLMKGLSDAGVKMANLLYLNPEYCLNPRFKEIVAQSYKGKALEGNSADEINTWVQESTNGLIKDIVSQEDLEDFFLAMANAIYFKGDWRQEFEAEDTRQAIFKCPGPSGEIDETVEMMKLVGRFKYYEDDLCQAVEMPYKNAQGMAMTLILPKNFNEFSFINAQFFEKIQQQMSLQKSLEIKLPKFKIEEKIDVKETLKKMGMHELFEKPDFSNMVDLSHQPTADVLPKLFIDKITQKSVLAINEAGTEAATVTVQIMRPESCFLPPPSEKQIHFDRPFLSTLTYEGVPVLFGAIRAPETIS